MKKFFNVKDIDSEEFHIEESKINDIAIIGISAKLPDADGADEFWENLKNERDSIKEFPTNRKIDIGDHSKLNFIGKKEIKFDDGGYLHEIDKFDYSFFNIAPKDASLMDPNQRIFLETAWEAIENAGYGGECLKETMTGVYIGFNSNSINPYGRIIYEKYPDLISRTVTGNINPIIASRISFLLDLKGPNMLIDSACSSSLVAVHLACQSIKTGECDYAIAGGIKINLSPISGLINIGIESSEYTISPFDYNANGTVWGEGSVALLLKPLDRAIKDRDNIYAVIKGSAVNQDGASIGITAPSVQAQEDVICRAWRNAGVLPETISYIESHGTGTKIGDPIEIQGIKRAFERYTNKKQFCAIGSVKSNIGHLDSAAGITGLLKVILALKNNQIPQTIHFKNANKEINFVDSPVFVNDKLIDWNFGKSPKRAGVSAFGLSGTNCHIVVEEWLKKESNQINNNDKILVLSAKSRDSIIELIKSYKKFLVNNRNVNLDNMCFTAGVGRGHYNVRVAIIFDDLIELENKIDYLLSLSDLHNINDENIFYGEHKIINSMNDERIIKKGEITENQIRELNQRAKNIIDKIETISKAPINILRDICTLYVKGARIYWKIFHKGLELKRISIPTYRFEKNRCWIDSNLQDDITKKNLFNETFWEISDLKVNSSCSCQQSILIFKDIEDKNNEIIEKLKFKFKNVIIINIGDKFNRINDEEYEVGQSEEEYNKLFLKLRKNRFNKIIHLATLERNRSIINVNDLKGIQEKGVYSLFYITKSILKTTINEDIDIVLISDHVNSVTGYEEVIKPENSTILGLGKVLNQECLHLKCRSIDIDFSTKVDNIIEEICTESTYYSVAYRQDKRYCLKVRKVNFAQQNKLERYITDRGIYLITGGTGDLGLEVAKNISKQGNNLNIALINRTIFPKREQWNEILKEDIDERKCKIIKCINKIEKTGSKVSLYNADVSNYDELKKIIKEVESKHGVINGVFHCAGIIGNGILLKKDKETFQSVLSPKVYGTWCLDKLLSNKVEYLILFSSVNSLLGIAGQGDYTAANSYLDSFVQYRNKNGNRTVCINWAPWSEIGMAARSNTALMDSLSVNDALKALDAILETNISHVIVGNIGDVNNYSEEDFKLMFSELGSFKHDKIQINNEVKKTIVNNIKLTGKKKDHYTETERMIASIWSDILGSYEFDIYDLFFEFGGDSISLSIVNEKIEEIYPGKVSLADLFSYPSIYDLGKFIDSKNNDFKDDEERSNEEIHDIINNLSEGKLTEDEASNLLKKLMD